MDGGWEKVVSLNKCSAPELENPGGGGWELLSCPCIAQHPYRSFQLWSSVDVGDYYTTVQLISVCFCASKMDGNLATCQRVAPCVPL